MSVCNVCGWLYDETTDSYCSGCGKVLRELNVVPAHKRHLLFFGNTLTLKLENPGDYPVTISSWRLENLDGLCVSFVHYPTPPARVEAGGAATANITHAHSALPIVQSGRLIIDWSCGLPLAIEIDRSPTPRFDFFVDGQLVRKGQAVSLCRDPHRHELSLAVEVRGVIAAALEQLHVYEIDKPASLYPLPASVSLPKILAAGARHDFQFIIDVSSKIAEAATHFTAVFQFEKCAPEMVSITVMRDAVIRHKQDRTLVGPAALARGDHTPQDIAITLSNTGGISADILQIQTASPWLSLQPLPPFVPLKPYQGSEFLFTVTVHPGKTHPGTSVNNGQLTVKYRQQNDSKLYEQRFNIPLQFVEPRAADYPVAVDFGNNGTCVAYYPPSGDIAILALDPHYPHIAEFPTIIEFCAYAPPDTVETGKGFRYGHELELTKYAGGNTFQHRAWGFKRDIGRDDLRIPRLDKDNCLREHTPDSLFEFYMREVLSRFQNKAKCQISSLVITYPACFSTQQISAMKQRLNHIFPQLDIIAEISEPEALALYYLRGHTSDQLKAGKAELFSVFDFGGGTTDVAIGTIRSDLRALDVTIHYSFSIDTLGGDQLTFALAKDLYTNAISSRADAESLFPNCYNDITSLSLDDLALTNFMNAMRAAERLKTNKDSVLDKLIQDGHHRFFIDQIALRPDARPVVVDVDYTAELFFATVGQPVERAFRSLQQSLLHLKSYNITASDHLDLLILGGNSSRLPLVRERAKAILGLSDEQIRLDLDQAKTAVALGALLFGRLLDDPQMPIIFTHDRHLKFPLGFIANDTFHVLFHAGARCGCRVTHRQPLMNPQGRFKLYVTKDISQTSFRPGDTNFSQVFTLPLSSWWHGEPCELTMSMTLESDGLRVSINDQAFMQYFAW